MPADVWKAFPRTWREDYLDVMLNGPRVRDGAAAPVGSILESDSILVPLNGCTAVSVCQGIPEGGKLTPLGYTLVPDSLVRELEDAAVGVGFGIVIPVGLFLVWCRHPEA